MSRAEALTGRIIKITTVLCVTEYMKVGGGYIKFICMEIIDVFKSKMLFELFMGNFIFPSSFLTKLVTFLLKLMSEMNILETQKSNRSVFVYLYVIL